MEIGPPLLSTILFIINLTHRFAFTSHYILLLYIVLFFTQITCIYSFLFICLIFSCNNYFTLTRHAPHVPPEISSYYNPLLPCATLARASSSQFHFYLVIYPFETKRQIVEEKDCACPCTKPFTFKHIFFSSGTTFKHVFR